MERTKFPQGKYALKIIEAKAYKISGKIFIKLQLEEHQPPTTLRQIYINKNKTLSEGVLKKKNTNRPTLKERNRKFLPLAQQLAKTIQSSKNMKYTARQIQQWSDEIRRLSEMNGIDYERIEKVLDWYEDNIGGEYVPVIESGYSLRQKFQKLESAVERDKRPNLNGVPKVKYIDNMAYYLCSDGKHRNKAGAIHVD